MSDRSGAKRVGYRVQNSEGRNHAHLCRLTVATPATTVDDPNRGSGEGNMKSDVKESKVFSQWFEEWMAKTQNHSVKQPRKVVDRADSKKQQTESLSVVSAVRHQPTRR